MAQAKRKASTKTAKKSSARPAKRKTSQRSCKKKSGIRYEKYQRGQESNPFFLVTMSILAATLLFADLFMLTA